MYYLFFYSILALFSTPISARSLSSEEDLTRSNVDLQSVRDAVQLIARLQQRNEHGSSVGMTQARQGNKKLYQGVDQDYLGFGGKYYMDINRLMDLVQKNYQAKRGHAWKRSLVNPRVYYISNPEVLEQYWKNLNKQVSSESSDRDSRGSNRAETNLLKYLISLRREGDENDNNAELNQDGNRFINNDDVNLAPEFRSTIEFIDDYTKANPYENTQSTFEVPPKIASRTVGFKSHDNYDNDDLKRREKSKSEFEKVPARVQRDDEDIRKSIESFKSAWKMKKESRVREGNKLKPIAYDKPKVAVRGRLGSNYGANNNAHGAYPPYGRTPVPIVGKTGIYEEE